MTACEGVKAPAALGLATAPRNTQSGLELTPFPDASLSLLSLAEKPPGVGGRRIPCREQGGHQPAAWGRLVRDCSKMEKEAEQSQLPVKGGLWKERNLVLGTERSEGRGDTGTGGEEVWCEAGCSRWTSGQRAEEGPA